MLVSAIHQHESAIAIHTPPSSGISFLPPTLSHPSRLSQSTGFELPSSHSKLPLGIYFIYGNVYIAVLLFPFFPPSPSFILGLMWRPWHMIILNFWLNQNQCLVLWIQWLMHVTTNTCYATKFTVLFFLLFISIMMITNAGAFICPIGHHTPWHTTYWNINLTINKCLLCLWHCDKH